MKTYTKGCILRLRKPRIDIKDIAGHKFGDLTVLHISGKGKYRGIMWRCKCDCGNECDAFGGHLRDGTRKSCGCWSEKRVNETGINRVFSIYKKRSKDRSVDFNLTIEQLKELISANCSYCGIEPTNELRRQKSKKTQIKYNGIDRIDPKKSYSAENCVTSCIMCNRSKSDTPLHEWLSYLRRLFNYQRMDNGI